MLQAQTEFPELLDYRACWPVQDLIKTRLSDTSKRWNTKQKDLASEKIVEGAVLLAGGGTKKLRSGQGKSKKSK